MESQQHQAQQAQFINQIIAKRNKQLSAMQGGQPLPPGMLEQQQLRPNSVVTGDPMMVSDSEIQNLQINNGHGGNFGQQW